MSRDLLSFTALMHQLGYEHAPTFRAHLKAAQEDRGFPLPVPGFGQHWDPRAIDAWLDGFIPARAEVVMTIANDIGIVADDLEAQRAELVARVDASVAQLGRRRKRKA